ncbi:MAG: transglutaminase domain-containing protein [Solobacterium sp.]|nr:transglutaminase domain-containing protein [Solobacterium sp.]
MLKILKDLRTEMPEDIAKLKYAGMFAEADRLIDIKLEDDRIPEAVRNKLLTEKEIMKRLENDYPYTEEEAMALIRKEIPDFTEEELHEWMDRGAADWIFVSGKKHLQNRFFASLKKVYPEMAQRAQEAAEDRSYLDDNVRYMKQYGKAGWHFRAKTVLRIKDECFQPGFVRVHLPVPSACINMRNIRILNTSPGGIIDPEDSLSRTVCFEKTLETNEEFYVEYEYDSVVRYTAFSDRETWIDPDAETGEQEPHIVFTPLIRSLCQQLSGDETDPLKLARRFYDFVTTKVVYSFMRQYLGIEQIPDYCISSLKGDCGVQALTFITLCRCAGIPARWQSGKFTAPGTSGNHDWAMFRIEPYGWLFADCSFGGSAFRAGCKERHDFYFGNLDPFRMAANQAFQQEFTIPKKHWRIDPYDNQTGEAEYADRGLLRQELDCSFEILEMHQLEQEEL